MARIAPYLFVSQALIAALCLLGGCGSQPSGSSPQAQGPRPLGSDPQSQKQIEQIRETRLRLFDPQDPCAMRLHDIAGPLLLYYRTNNKLPPRLEDLKGFDSTLQFTCPVSGKPYIYNPDGIPISEPQGWLLVYDAEAIHKGLRWGIVVMEPKPGQPLSADVLAILDRDLMRGGNQ